MCALRARGLGSWKLPYMATPKRHRPFKVRGTNSERHDDVWPHAAAAATVAQPSWHRM